ncbi:Serine/threonine-protein kinase PknD [Methylobacterium crusticola]|uniref:Serine/threonine-protein kinase PknD n=1 Tax=Methylobacterium crusticola TaxID=1697972 RepID=A0ABQ4QYL2_9HYPH|nr:serine/threonine-protein kinase [Methylobacterium crusticola]GJD50490.1 Serine/threonine-protein kinase PknD [Methylobacterium crusticola]
MRSLVDHIIDHFGSGRLSFADAVIALRQGEGAQVGAAATILALQRAIDDRRLPYRIACLLHDAVQASVPASTSSERLPGSRVDAAEIDCLVARLRTLRQSPEFRPAYAEGRIGQVLRNRFVLDAEIGHGGMGVVYRAVDRRRQELDSISPYVAIKLLAPRWVGDRTAMRALEAEARHTQALRHPNIVGVHDFDREGADTFIVMENLVGYSLDVMLLRHLDFAGSALARTNLTHFLAGLAAAHQQGVIHADLKPSNLFICTNGQLKILDFGIAAVLSETSADDAIERAVTPAYASPERLSGQSRSLRDDVYALGCLIHLFLAGRHPFDRVDAVEAMRRGLVPSRIDGLSSDANTIVARALSFDPAVRPVDAREVQAMICFA